MCWALAPCPVVTPSFLKRVYNFWKTKLYYFFVTLLSLLSWAWFGATQASESNHTGLGLWTLPSCKTLGSCWMALPPRQDTLLCPRDLREQLKSSPLNFHWPKKSHPAMFSDNIHHSAVLWGEVTIGFFLCNNWRNWGTQGNYGSSESHSESEEVNLLSQKNLFYSHPLGAFMNLKRNL